MMEPYRNLEVSRYSVLRSRPMILSRFWISVFPVTCLKLASLTFKTLPFSGKTPYLSRPTTLSPATARDLAESPSVRIKVQSAEFLPPASLASSSLGIPITRVVFFVLLRIWRDMSTFCFALTQSKMSSTTPLFMTCFMNLSESSQLLPNLLCLVVSVSFVWESKAGFSMRQLMKTRRWFLTCEGLMSIPPRFLPFTTFKMVSTSWSDTCETCVPPLIVLIEFTKLTCWKLPSERLKATSQRLLQTSCTQGGISLVPCCGRLRYRST
mmetsp:Transcript_84091/g.265457  ORF Transcript_84091/g.265457 Transcript_84091/m.265457 type:complete len:267 (-) Transcript_84091:718-1518(-)